MSEYKYEIRHEETTEWLGDWRVYKVCTVGFNYGKSELVADFDTEEEAESSANKWNRQLQEDND